MITVAILAVLGVILFAVLKAMFKPQGGAVPAAPSASQGEPAAQPLELDPWDAKKGDIISISGGAEDFSDLDFPVDRRSAYEARNHRWIDLSGEYRGRRVYLEVYRYPQQDLIGILDSRKLTLSDLGVNEQQLADFDSRQDPSAYITFEGKNWHFESSREIGYFENEAGEGEGLYRWLFREDNGSRLLCIEKWEGEPFDVRVARRLNPRDITVYRAA
jgi:hypothetical protein